LSTRWVYRGTGGCANLEWGRKYRGVRDLDKVLFKKWKVEFARRWTLVRAGGFWGFALGDWKDILNQ